MSNTYHLVCDETKERVWVGQGWGEMTSLYSGELKTMEALKIFLNGNHSPRVLRFVCSGADDEFYSYKEIK